jgi:hypothetical protein
MTTLEEALAAVVRARDCPAVRRLCLDCWAWSRVNGEELGLGYARMLLDGVEAYAAHERAVRVAANWGSPPPAGPPRS